MAPLKSLRTHDGRYRRDDRGQLLLVGAFILAILLVALAMVLNAAIYTEAVAAHGNDRAAVFDAVQHRDDTARALSDLVVAVNDDAHLSRSGAESSLQTSVSEWDTLAARQQAATGRATSVTVTSVAVETNVSQTNASRSFTNASNTSQWTLVENVNDSRSFELSVDPADLAVPSNATNTTVLEDESFHVEVTDNGSTWRVFVFQSPSNASNVTVAVDAPGSSTLDTHTATQNGTDPVVVDFVSGTVDGTNTSALSFYGNLTGPSSVAFDNGGDAAGTYNLVVDGDVSDPNDYDSTSDGDPSARAVVTELSVTLTYEMQGLRYTTPITVTGGSNV
ncbi:hypothetical protein ACH9L7_17760 (plasmid) [Haloferax sp. S1W]|uniref:DUF7261 family protein n=1 Tax=Haloferax sp. S1W TaxID=3377110 RepID=UPI0037C89341